MIDTETVQTELWEIGHAVCGLEIELNREGTPTGDRINALANRLAATSSERAELQRRIDRSLGLLAQLELDEDGGPWWHYLLVEVKRILKGEEEC